MQDTMVPPALVNAPAAYKYVPSSAKALTDGEVTPDMPLPKADQLVPSNLAIRFAATTPAVVNVPPT